MRRSNYNDFIYPNLDLELQPFSEHNQPESVLKSYRLKHIDPRSAIKKLEHTIPKGQLWSGEIALEQAHRVRDEEAALNYLDHAERMFNRVRDLGHIASETSLSDITSKAKIQLDYIPIHSLMILEKKLPSQSLATKIHEKTVETGFELTKELEKRRLLGIERGNSQIIGLIGELAVMTLFQRSVISQNKTESEFPILSHPTEDRRNTNGSSLNHGWDISYYKQNDGDLFIASKIQVKNRLNRRGALGRPPAVGISNVYIEPDLGIYKGEVLIANKIIEESFIELFDFDGDYTSKILDKRMTKAILGLYK